MERKKNLSIIDLKDNRGLTALHLASFIGQEKLVSMLLKSNADVHIKSNDDLTAFQLALNENVKQMFSEHLIDIKPEDILEASWNGYDKIVEMLIDKGIDVNLKDEDGETALHKGLFKESKNI